MTTPECRGIKLQVDSGEKQFLQREHLPPADRQEIWKLLIEYRPTILGQSFTLRDPKGIGVGGGEADAKQMASFVCESAKHNGVLDVW